MDIVIPILKETTELKYAIRSFEKHIPHDKIFLFDKGDKPGLQHKEANIFHKIMQACNDARVSEDFIFANDDHFILPGFDVHQYYYSDWPGKVNGIYQKTLLNTYPFANGMEYFDIHCPCVFNKQKFKSTVGRLNWNVLYGYCIKTIYCQMNNVTGIFYKDLKIGNPVIKKQILNMIQGRLFFSTSTPINRQIIEVLEELYQVFQTQE